jgi:putative transposase
MSSNENGYPSRQGCYFLTFNTVDWVDVFIRPVYKQIIVHSLNYFIDNKGLNVFAWCLMTNHLHLLVQARENGVIAEIENEYKSFTAKKILQDIDTEPDIRKTWMMNHFENFGNIFGLLKKFHVWQMSSSPVFIDMNKKDTLTEYAEFIHGNPVRDRIVDTASDYLYSSARDYSGMKGLVHITKLAHIDEQMVTADMTGNFFGKFIRN